MKCVQRSSFTRVDNPEKRPPDSAADRWSRFFLFLVLLTLPVSCGRPAAEAIPPSPQPTATALPDTPTGSLVYIEQENTSQVLLKYDIVREAKLPLFRGLPRGWLLQSDVSPDGSQIVLAYAPPPAENEVQLGQFKLYLMPADGATEPVLLGDPGSPEAIFVNPVWAPDGRHIYYAHLTPNPPDLLDFVVTLERLELESGQVEALVDDGLWPRLSPDGSRLTYVAYDRETRERTLQVSRPDGSNPIIVADSQAFTDIDAPLFSPDGAWVYFGAVVAEASSSLSWFDRLLGVRPAAAHGVPSDWWRVPVTGGAPERISSLNETGMAGSFSPDGRYFAFSSVNGLYVMAWDGGEVTWLVKTSAGVSLSWLP